MAQYQDPAAADALRYLRGRVDKLDNEVALLRSAQGKASLDRGDHEAIPNPYEGQLMVNHASDQPYYYSRGEWRPFAAGSTVWAALSTEDSGWEYQGAGAEDTVDWYTAWLSDAAGDYFGLDFDEGGGQFGDDIVFLTMKQSGIYTFTQQLHTADLDATGNEAFFYQTRLNVAGGTPGTSWGSNAGAFPGQVGTVALLQDREQLWIGTGSGDDLWLNRSWTIPVNPGNEARCGEMRMFHDPQSSDPYWTVRLWVVRHGDFDWAGDEFNDLANSTWTTGDPIPS